MQWATALKVMLISVVCASSSAHRGRLLVKLDDAAYLPHLRACGRSPGGLNG